VRRCVAYLYKKIQRRRSTNNKLNYKGKKRYKRKKNIIYKKRKERKLKQRKDK
jgi:hypothetical protein